jgi:outer membrane usher protein
MREIHNPRRRARISRWLGCVSLAALTAGSMQHPARAQDDKPPPIPTVTTDGTPPAPQAAPSGKPAPPAMKTGRAYTIALGLRDGQRYIGDVRVTIAADGAVTVDSAQVLKLLKSVVGDAALAKLAKAVADEKMAPLEDFAKGGIPAHYDSASLQIVLAIPPEARISQSLEVAQLDRAMFGAVAQPASFSGYLNMRGSADYVEEGSAKGFGDPTVLLDGAVRAGGFVLEGEGEYAPGQSGQNAFTRQGTRLVYDDDSDLMRWTLGDLRVQTDGFQGSPTMAGLSISRLYDELAPQENVRPRGNRTFTLQRASTVQTFVNGQPVQQVRLEPGTYDASNFPFVEGANNVDLVITDDAGNRETLNFSIFFDRSLLKPGLTEFGAFAGVNSVTQRGDTRYPDSRPLFTGFVRHGLTDTLTLSGNIQADRDVQMVGLGGLWGSPIGTFGIDLADSNARNIGKGYALNLNYQALNQEKGDFQSQTVSAAFEMRSRNFATLGGTGAGAGSSALVSNPYKWQAALAYGRTFGQYTFGQLQGSYAAGRDGQEDVGSITGTLGFGITNDMNLNVDAGYSTGGFQKGLNFGIQLTWRMSETANLRGEYQSKPQISRLTYQQSEGRGVGAWNVSGSLDQSPGAVDFNGSANYSANRAELGVTQVSTYDLRGSRVTDQRTTLQAGTAIAFAGNSVAIGRPIFDSFALFDPHPSLGDARVVVEPGPHGALARSDALGPAVLSDLGSRSLRTVTYDVPEAPPGYDIGTGSLRVVPPYRSGYKVTVGSDYSTLVIGRLLDAEGAPVSLLAGTATELDVPNGKTLTVFTSRDGRFGAQGLRAGRWRIDMPSSPATSYIVTIPKDSKSLVRVGDLKPQPVENK